MVRKRGEFYFVSDRRDLTKVGGDLALLCWYSKLKDYRQRFKPDKYGFIRIPPSVYEDDLGMSKKQVQRYNKKLEDKGLLKVDRMRRGGRTWAGFRLV